MEDSETILLTILDASAELELQLGDQWPSLCEELADLVLRLDAAETTPSLRQEIDAFLARLLATPAGGRARELIRQARRETTSTTRGGSPDVDNTSLETAEETPVIPVYYGTDRDEHPGASVEKRYTGDRGSLRFGVAHVSIPPGHKIGRVEAPKWWRFELRPDRRKHVVLLTIDEMDRTQYCAALSNAISSADSRDVLLYVHGYNVNFADAARRTAQIAFDLRFRGRTLLYSWPSKGGKLGYMADEATIEWATPHFEEFLQMALTESGARTVHLLAHSMGNRVLVRAIERLVTSALPSGSATIGQVIFAAPDIDRDVFLQIAAAFSGRGERFTLYASDRDVALKLSRVLHQGPRAGDVGGSPVITSGVDTVDASNADTSLFGLGHSYYADRRSILSDIFTLLTEGTPPPRFELTERASTLGPYWSYRL